MSADEVDWGWGEVPQSPQPGWDHWRHPHYPVFHYSTVEGLTGILKSSALWASDAKWMNDPAESDFGLAAFKRAWATLRSEVIDASLAGLFDEWLSNAEARLLAQTVYILCAALDGDSLAIWRTYGGGEGADGVAIELDQSAELRVLDAREGATITALPDWAPSPLWITVWYGEHISPLGGFRSESPMRRFMDSAFFHLDQERKGAIDPIRARVLEREFAILVRMTKHGSYATEEEARVFTYAPPEIARQREGFYGQTRFVEITAAGAADLQDFTVVESSPLPVSSVTLSPSAPDRSLLRVRGLLDRNGFPHVPLRRSDVPMRRREC